MVQVHKAVAFDRVLKKDGEIQVNGVIPQGWSEYIGVTGTMNNHKGWITSVQRTGNDDFTVRFKRTNDSGEVEPIPADTKVKFTLDIVGVQNDD